MLNHFLLHLQELTMLFSRFFNRDRSENLAADTLAALSKAQAFIEFKPDGTIISANKRFLEVVGYSLDEVQGKHHSMFLSDDYAASSAYSEFWNTLQSGQFQAARFNRLAKG